MEKQEKKYIITETAAAIVLKFLTELPWKTSNEVISYFRQNLKEVQEEIPEKVDGNKE